MRNSNLKSKSNGNLKKEKTKMTNVIEAETKAQDYNREMVGNRYQHFKGNIYEVDHIGVDTRDLALVVVYHE